MKIMVCYSESENAKEGLKEAAKRAKAFNGEVLVVTSVVEDKKLYPKMIEPYEQELEKAQSFLNENNVPCETTISFRKVDNATGEDLLSFAEKENVDEIIVGIKSRSRVGKLLLGSTAQLLILKARCPVLGVKKR
ncbi:MAG: universal stress protein [Dissulfuribacterales bacterium]